MTFRMRVDSDARQFDGWDASNIVSLPVPLYVLHTRTYARTHTHTHARTQRMREKIEEK